MGKAVANHQKIALSFFNATVILVGSNLSLTMMMMMTSSFSLVSSPIVNLYHSLVYKPSSVSIANLSLIYVCLHWHIFMYP